MVFYGSLFVSNAAWLPVLPGAIVGGVGLMAIGCAVAGAGIVSLAGRWYPGGPRPVGPIVAYAAAGAGSAAFLLCALRLWRWFDLA